MTNLPFDSVSESYEFLWGWPGRAENADGIAARLQQMVRLLAQLEPAYGELWPFGVRKDAPGPVLALDPDDFAALIDRRARVDRPPRPAPVGPDGYHLALANNRRSPDPFFLRLMVSAGVCGEDAENAVELHVQPNGPAWQDEGLMLQLFEGAVDVWDARWGAVYYRQATGGEGVRQRPRLAWAAEGLSIHPVPPFLSPYPYPFPFEQPPTTRRYSAQLGGEVEEWR